MLMHNSQTATVNAIEAHIARISLQFETGFISKYVSLVNTYKEIEIVIFAAELNPCANQYRKEQWQIKCKKTFRLQKKQKNN